MGDFFCIIRVNLGLTPQGQKTFGLTHGRRICSIPVAGSRRQQEAVPRLWLDDRISISIYLEYLSLSTCLPIE